MPLSILGNADTQTSLAIPLYSHTVSAGFPSPAQDYIDKTLDLNELCIKHPSATFFVRVEGDSMIDAGIHHGDFLVVDRSIEAKHGDVVIAAILGELTVKELQLNPCTALVPRNCAYKPIQIPEGVGLDVLGVVVSVVRKLRGG